MTKAVELGRWSRRRWISTVTAVGLGQAAVVMMLVRPVPPTPPRPTFATRLHFVAERDPQRGPATLPTLTDPALFALPSLDGFSGSAWLRYPPLKHPPAEYTESPEWLRLRPSALGEEFFEYLATNTLTPPLLVDAPLPPVLRYELSFPGEPVAPFSRLRLEGNLARRGLVHPIDLPVWPHTEILSNTVIQAAVDAAGLTFSSTILARSGLSEADEHARRLVEQARFRPRAMSREGEDDLTWGTLVFLWHTAPLPVTNGVRVPGLP